MPPFSIRHPQLLVITLGFAASAFAGADFSNVIAQPSGLGATAVIGPIDGNDKPTGKPGSIAAIDLLNGDGSGWTGSFDTGLDWSFEGSSDDSAGGPFTGNVESNAGTLTFDTPMTGAFAISLKAANFYSLYYFDASFAGTTSIDFDTIGTATNPQGKAQDLSHASLFTAGGTPPTGVPSPTAALAGLGLMGLLVSRRRRK